MTHSIFIPIWDCQLHLMLWPQDPRAALIAAHVKEDDIDEWLTDDDLAITELNGHGHPFILITEERKGSTLTGLLAHELFHVVQKMLAHRGVDLSNKTNNEAHAYLLGWLMEEVMKVLDKGAQGG